MKLYLAARYDRRTEMREVRAKLQNLGFAVTSRWLDETEEIEKAVNAGCERTRRETADIDLRDIAAADALLVFQDGPASSGRHFEAGYAAGIDVPVISIGPGPNSIFYSLTYQAEDLEGALAILAKIATPEQMLASFRRVITKCRLIGANVNAGRSDRLNAMEYVLARCAVYFAGAHHLRHG